MVYFSDTLPSKAPILISYICECDNTKMISQLFVNLIFINANGCIINNIGINNGISQYISELFLEKQGLQNRCGIFSLAGSWCINHLCNIYNGICYSLPLVLL